ncbi:hypothetical protein DFH29DRAFT_947568 [Suillus ampliporus]|nr:hypothetical protein DFH29DRAFT_947568 [Suillus ampliporus]
MLTAPMHSRASARLASLHLHPNRRQWKCTKARHLSCSTNFDDLIDGTKRTGRVLDAHLAYEPNPRDSRCNSMKLADDQTGVACDAGLFLVMYTVTVGGTSSKPSCSVCSGFAVGGNGRTGSGSVIVTCAHALQEASTFTLSPASNPSSTTLSLASDGSNDDKVMLSGSLSYLSRKMATRACSPCHLC